MKTLKPLARELQRKLWVLLLRRLILWATLSLILLMAENLLSLGFSGHLWQLMLRMTGFSSLPVFLLWPLDEKPILDRLRRLDEETVFEAYLEAPAGPARAILQRLAAEKASSLSLRKIPREPVWAGLKSIVVSALAGFLLMEGASFWFLGRSLTFSTARSASAEKGLRIEDRGFSDYATEDPAARRSRRERALDQKEATMSQGVNPMLGAPEPPSDTTSSDHMPEAGSKARPAEGSSAKEASAKRKQGELEADQTAGSANPSPGWNPGEGHRNQAESPSGQAHAPMVSPEASGLNGQTVPPGPSPQGQGYEHTGDTKVPSPLMDYRARFESRYAERTGTHIAASSRMGLGELRDYQRRYFESFTLHAEVGTADDPYTALLKRRWTELKGGN